MSHIGVIDFGKTNASLALVDPGPQREIALRRMPNRDQSGPPSAHFKTEAHWESILSSLAELGAEHGIAGVLITNHDATARPVEPQRALAGYPLLWRAKACEAALA